MSIKVDNVSKNFGNFVALDKVSLEAEGGSLLALLGPSGSGKTTLLRVIAGLETADTGSVFYQEEDVTGQSARDRNIGFVCSALCLVPSYDGVRQRGLRLEGARPGKEIDSRTRSRAAPAGAAGIARESLPQPAFRWPTTARRARARSGD